MRSILLTFVITMALVDFHAALMLEEQVDTLADTTAAVSATLEAVAEEPAELHPIEPLPMEPTVAEEVTEPTAPVLDPYEVDLIGRTIWGEAMGVGSEAEQAAVAWCILNRVDAWGKSVEEVVTAPMQFVGYRPSGECPQEHLDLAADVLTRWHNEKAGAENVGRTLPAEYLYFVGDLEAHNWFSIEWRSRDFWSWELPSPYES